MIISIYLKETGIIIENRSVLNTSQLSHLGEEYGYIEGIYEPNKYKWNGSEVVAHSISYTPGKNTQLVREERNRRLSQSDWTQVPDSPLSDSKKAEWATYRQELRDMMTSYTDTESNTVNAITWPTPPDIIDPTPVAN